MSLEEHDDLDLMLAIDGEGSPLGESLSLDQQLKADAVRQIGEVVRTYAELETDDAAPALAGLWSRVEDGLEPSAAVIQTKRLREGTAAENGWLEALFEWLGAHRGHFLTGAVSAAAAVMIVAVSNGASDRTETASVVVQQPALPIAPVVDQAESTPAEIESLEVYEGTGTVLTLPEEDGEGSTSIIWLAPQDAEETLEGPI